jgi:DNA-binding transcriptional ArsR family regulator
MSDFPRAKRPPPPRFKIPKGLDRRRWLKFPASALFDTKITGPQLRTLGAICMHANKVHETYVGHAELGRILSISREAAGRHYRNLMRLGYIERTAARRQGFITRIRYDNPQGAALNAMRMTPEARAAAERGLEKMRKVLESKGTAIRVRKPDNKEHHVFHEQKKNTEETSSSSFFDSL